MCLARYSHLERQCAASVATKVRREWERSSSRCRFSGVNGTTREAPAQSAPISRARAPRARSATGLHVPSRARTMTRYATASCEDADVDDPRRSTGDPLEHAACSGLRHRAALDAQHRTPACLLIGACRRAPERAGHIEQPILGEHRRIVRGARGKRRARFAPGTPAIRTRCPRRASSVAAATRGRERPAPDSRTPATSPDSNRQPRHRAPMNRRRCCGCCLPADAIAAATSTPEPPAPDPAQRGSRTVGREDFPHVRGAVGVESSEPLLARRRSGRRRHRIDSVPGGGKPAATGST